MTSRIGFLINVFKTRMCGQTLLFIVIANCTISSDTYSRGDRSFAAAAPQVWNSIRDSVREFTLCEDTFAKHLKSHLNM